MSLLGEHAYASQNAVTVWKQRMPRHGDSWPMQKNKLLESVPVAWRLSWHVPTYDALLWASADSV